MKRILPSLRKQISEVSDHLKLEDDIIDLRFGVYNLPMAVKYEDLEVSISEQNSGHVYRRKFREDELEKIILSKQGKIHIHPVEPVNLPKAITRNLQIAFSRPITVEPKAKNTVFITFPVEIGIFIVGKNSSNLIDVVGFNEQKFTEYGDLAHGIICRYWESEIFTSLPDTNPFHQGIMKLTISNPTPNWIDISKTVFNSYGMKIFYSPKVTSVKGTMKIINDGIAETDYLETPLEKGMRKSLEVYSIKMTSISTKRFIMEGGL